MDHQQAHDVLPAYVDNELSLTECAAFERHLARCDACRAALDAQRRVRVWLTSPEFRYPAPDALRARIQADLRAHRPVRERIAGWLAPRRASGLSIWAPAGAMALGALALACSGVLYLSAPSADAQLRSALVDNHVRSLQLDRLTDVVSTDRHTVKPWFDGKLDFAPPVRDFAQAGYPLVGGRLDYVGGRAVAVLVYRYKRHPIDVYVWPGDSAGATPRIDEQHGYHVARWSAGHMNYWAITDAGARELDGLVERMRAGS
ncbi:anti-sigma factor family protein [Burkholderia stagnalis]|uniref:anti-sigma factor family protein n=1 Tax=Burkholderia stagnalis TaxID=1503054 RepID=UPI000F58F317|nr:anti-sigma factor [Burkholderia stagnalis]RQQ10820.1 anti-sigma factor [Burkholderia stagnalis]RQQ37789.1 anti-sigma factor [Burkholderia stagnalis]RQY27671.1 anti-sigma factor [Burkholderia stagnalis]RQY41578.1 anti-sigma factor [Burkholderia stagnalis]RQY60846.1 anti-sigma factor [Burkholderia stagnalis]